MDLRQLRYFVTVAENGHVTRAAQILGMQQPPLSQQIKALEADLGLQLLTRHARGVSLTQAGERLLIDARRLIADFEALRTRMADVAGGVQGRLGIAFTSSAAAHRFTPAFLRTCRQTYPGISLTIDEDNAAGIIEAVDKGRLDGGLLRVPTSMPDRLAFDVLLREPVVVALPLGHRLLAGHPVHKPPRLKLHDLHGEDLILVRRPGAPGLYANLLALCQAQGVEPKVSAEVERMLTNLNLVAAGAGISVVPQSMAGIHRDAIAYCALDGTKGLDAPLTLVHRKGELAGPLARFVELAHLVARREPTPRSSR